MRQAQRQLTKVYLAWSRVRRADNVDGYVRQVPVRTYLDEQRRQWRSEQPTGDPLDGLRPDPATASDQRLDLLRALATLPPRQRAAVVLRCWEDLPISEVARCGPRRNRSWPRPAGSAGGGSASRWPEARSARWCSSARPRRQRPGCPAVRRRTGPRTATPVCPHRRRAALRGS